jgi:hypothetical protein
MPCSQYYTAFGDLTARDLALRCFRAMDAAWHSDTYGGFDELPENEIPPSPPVKATPTSTKLTEAAATRRPSAAAAAAAAAGRPTTAAAAAAAASRRPAAAAAARRPAAATAAVVAPQQREQKVRTLNVLMHGTEALTALHKVTKGEVSRLWGCGSRAGIATPCCMRDHECACCLETLTLRSMFLNLC